jgi:hypothetical protein
MQKVPAVEEAKTLLESAKDWGVWKWLTDKQKMRSAADHAWEVLDEVEEKVRGAWPEELQKAYADLSGTAKRKGKAADAELKAQAGKLKEARDQAHAIRMDAENMFVEAEKKMSTGMARDAAQKAIEAFVAREKLIRKFETAGRAK